MTQSPIQRVQKDTKAPLFENYIPLHEFVERTPFSKWTFYKWVRAGLPHKKIRGRIFVSPEEAALWLERTSK